MQTKAIVFDLFHTLTGPESERSTLPLTCDVLGIDRAIWDRALTAEQRWRLAGEERDPLAILSALARSIEHEASEASLRMAVDVRTGRFRHSLTSIPSANLETLKQLRLDGFKLGLISNADVMEVAAWADSPLAGLFDVEIFSCEVGCVKPEPEIYAKCLDALNVRGHECVFVGDGGSNELAGAKAAGMTTVLVSGMLEQLWPDRIPARIAQADYHIKWVPDLLSCPAIRVVR